MKNIYSKLPTCILATYIDDCKKKRIYRSIYYPAISIPSAKAMKTKIEKMMKRLQLKDIDISFWYNDKALEMFNKYDKDL